MIDPRALMKMKVSIAALGAAALACVGPPLEGHCWWEAGDETCAQLHAGEGSWYCSHMDEPCPGPTDRWGCMPAPPTTDACHSPCGNGQSALEDSSCVSAAGDSGDSGDSGDTGDTGDTGDGDPSPPEPYGDLCGAPNGCEAGEVELGQLGPDCAPLHDWAEVEGGSIADALASLTAPPAGHFNLLRIHPNPESATNEYSEYTEPPVVIEHDTVIQGSSRAWPKIAWTSDSVQPTISVRSGVTVRVINMRVNNVGFGGALTVEHDPFTDEGGALFLDRSVAQGEQWAVKLDTNARLEASSSFLHATSPVSYHAPLSTQPRARVVLSYSTVVSSSAHALACAGSGVGPYQVASVTSRCSILDYASLQPCLADNCDLSGPALFLDPSFSDPAPEYMGASSGDFRVESWEASPPYTSADTSACPPPSCDIESETIGASLRYGADQVEP